VADQTPAGISRIHIPPRTEHVAGVRSFVGAIGRHFGCSEETVEDLRLVATETCAQAFEEGTAPDGIEIRASADAGGLLLEIEPAARFSSTSDRQEPLDPASGERRRALIQALFPEVRIVDERGIPVVRIRAPLDGSPPSS
jgi:hypothetical protein